MLECKGGSSRNQPISNNVPTKKMCKIHRVKEEERKLFINANRVRDR